MKKIIKQFVVGFIWIMIADVANAQQGASSNKQEKKIQSLIGQMTLQEKVSLLHANSKFYVPGIKRLGILEWALSDGPHGVRAEINRDDWAYAGWTNDSATFGGLNHDFDTESSDKQSMDLPYGQDVTDKKSYGKGETIHAKCTIKNTG